LDIISNLIPSLIFVEYLIFINFLREVYTRVKLSFYLPFPLSHCVLRRGLPSLLGEVETTLSCAEMGFALSDPSLSREIETTLLCAEEGSTLSNPSLSRGIETSVVR
jgi:hypothetical protein